MLRPQMTHADDENRGRQLAVGVGILVLLTVAVCGVLIGWRYLPGLLGEWIGTMIGVMTTPFFLEGSFVVIFLTVVVAINSWRRKRDGDELVYLEQVEGPDVPPGMPEQAKWAVYRQQPLAGEIPTLRAQAEGALAIGDFDSAAEAIAAMTGAELKTPETLALRIALAKATGRSELAGQLEAELGDSGERKP
jgi:hypothetical protein